MADAVAPSVAHAPFALDPDWRGVPPARAGLSSAEVAAERWSPADGRMNLPLLTLDLPTFEANRSAMFDICARVGASIAPHAKTPMSPAIATVMVESGAWGTSVADLRQAGVMLRHGLRRILIANQIGGARAAGRLAALLSDHRGAEVHLFVDSVELIEALDAAWRHGPDLPPLGLLIEVGCGRGGVETQAEVERLVLACSGAGGGRLRLTGVAAYEGTANRSDEASTRRALEDLFSRLDVAFAAVRRAVGPGAPLIMSIGGSMLFDFAIAWGRPIVDRDGNALLLLRSGSCYYGDHGNMPGRFAAVASRNLLGDEASALIAGLRPALRLWAEVLSRHGATAICGLGLRDAAHDQGLPVPLRSWRDGQPIADLEGAAVIAKFNDQHAFIEAGEAALDIGDVVEFGVRHPCTTIDKHDLIYGLGHGGTVQDVFRTFFG